MKFVAMIMLILYNVTAYTQSAPAENWADSSRVVDLRELVVSSQTRSQTNKLAAHYRGNMASGLEDILARLPEVTLVKRGVYGMEPTIRSFSGSQVNVLVDGMRIHGACTDKMDPATIYIEPGNLGSLEVQTGNSGFASGSAIGGSFNFKIEEPELHPGGRLSGSLSSGYHTVSNGLYESLILNYGDDNYAIRASGTYRNHSNYRSGDSKAIPFTQYKKLNYSLGTKINMGRRMFLRADFIGDDGFNIGYPALPMDVGYASARIGALTLQGQGGKVAGWQLKVYGNYIRHFMDDTHRPNVYMHMDMPGSSKTFGFFSEARVNLNKKNTLSLRADGSATDLFASMTMFEQGQPPMFMLTWPDNRRSQWGASASWKHAASRSWQFRITGRSDLFTTKLTTQRSKDHVNIFSEKVNGTSHITANFSTEVMKMLNKYWLLTASVGMAQRAPSASEQYGFYLFNANDGFDYIGDPELKMEKAINAEFSAQFRKGDNRLKATGFISGVRNYIIGYIDPALSTMTHHARGVKRYRNEGKVFLAGAEGSAMLTVSRNLSSVTTIRYVYGMNELKDPLPGIAPVKIVQTLQWMKGGLTVKGEAEFAAKQDRVNKRSGEDRTAGYAVFHARAGYLFKLKNDLLEVQCGVENIFDESYHEHNDWGNIMRQGRNLYVQAKFSF